MIVYLHWQSHFAIYFSNEQLTWSHFVKIHVVCIILNISSQQIKSGPCVMNEVMLTNCCISCLHEVCVLKGLESVDYLVIYNI